MSIFAHHPAETQIKRGFGQWVEADVVFSKPEVTTGTFHEEAEDLYHLVSLTYDIRVEYDEYSIASVSAEYWCWRQRKNIPMPLTSEQDSDARNWLLDRRRWEKMIELIEIEPSPYYEAA